MLAFLTRRKDTTVTDTAPEATQSDILMRFLTHGGAEVHVTGSGRYGAQDNHWKCQGCDDSNKETFPLYDWDARDKANAHAADCRAMPKPTA